MKSPVALKLVRAANARSAPPKPPFGLDTFSDEGDAIAVEGDREETLEALVARVPLAAEIAPGTAVVLLGGKSRGLVARIFGQAEPVSRAHRGSALLARGYRDIHAQVDDASGDDLVIGTA